MKSDQVKHSDAAFHLNNACEWTSKVENHSHDHLNDGQRIGFKNFLLVALESFRLGYKCSHSKLIKATY